MRHEAEVYLGQPLVEGFTLAAVAVDGQGDGLGRLVAFARGAVGHALQLHQRLAGSLETVGRQRHVFLGHHDAVADGAAVARVA